MINYLFKVFTSDELFEFLMQLEVEQRIVLTNRYPQLGLNNKKVSFNEISKKMNIPRRSLTKLLKKAEKNLIHLSKETLEKKQREHAVEKALKRFTEIKINIYNVHFVSKVSLEHTAKRCRISIKYAKELKLQMEQTIEEEFQIIKNCIEIYSDKEKRNEEIVRLYTTKEMTVEQIAKLFNLKILSIRSIVSRCKKSTFERFIREKYKIQKYKLKLIESENELILINDEVNQLVIAKTKKLKNKDSDFNSKKTLYEISVYNNIGIKIDNDRFIEVEEEDNKIIFNFIKRENNVSRFVNYQTEKELFFSDYELSLLSETEFRNEFEKNKNIENMEIRKSELLKILDKTNHRRYLSMIYTELGNISKNLKDYSTAKEFYSQAMDNARSIKSKNNNEIEYKKLYFNSNSNYIKLLLENNELDCALELINQSIEENQAYFYYNIKGKILELLGNHREAIQCYSISTSIESSKKNLGAYQSYIRCLIMLGRQQEAFTLVKHFRSINVDNPRELNSKENESFIKIEEAKIYYSLGNVLEATKLIGENESKLDYNNKKELGHFFHFMGEKYKAAYYNNLSKNRNSQVSLNSDQLLLEEKIKHSVPSYTIPGYDVYQVRNDLENSDFINILTKPFTKQIEKFYYTNKMYFTQEITNKVFSSDYYLNANNSIKILIRAKFSYPQLELSNSDLANQFGIDTEQIKRIIDECYASIANNFPQEKEKNKKLVDNH